MCECACNAFCITIFQWPCWQKVLHRNEYLERKNNSYENNNNGNKFGVYVNLVVRHKKNNNLWMGKLIKENTRCECLHNIDLIRPVHCVLHSNRPNSFWIGFLCCVAKGDCHAFKLVILFEIYYYFPTILVVSFLSISSWTGFLFLLNKWKGCPHWCWFHCQIRLTREMRKQKFNTRKMSVNWENKKRNSPTHENFTRIVYNSKKHTSHRSFWVMCCQCVQFVRRKKK